MSPGAVALYASLLVVAHQAQALTPWSRPAEDPYEGDCDSAITSFEAAGAPVAQLELLRAMWRSGVCRPRQIRPGEVFDYQASGGGRVLRDVIALTGLWKPWHSRWVFECAVDGGDGLRYALIDPMVCRNCSVQIYPPATVPPVPWGPGPFPGFGGWWPYPGAFGGGAEFFAGGPSLGEFGSGPFVPGSPALPESGFQPKLGSGPEENSAAPATPVTSPSPATPAAANSGPGSPGGGGPGETVPPVVAPEPLSSLYLILIAVGFFALFYLHQQRAKRE